jgi:GLPGLI family protein
MATLVSQLSNAQIKVTYVEEYKVTKEMEPQMANPRVAELVKQQLQQMKKNSILYYADGQSLYETEKKKGEQVDNIIVHNLSEVGKVYKNEKNKEIISEESILDRQFLVVEKIHDFKWIMNNNETKKIGSYICKEATTENGIIAWYCPEIKISDGPSVYCGLSGLILEVELTSKKIVMKEIDLSYKEAKISKPTKGKTITRDEFAQLREKKMKELNVGSGGAVKVVKM